MYDLGVWCRRPSAATTAAFTVVLSSLRAAAQAAPPIEDQSRDAVPDTATEGELQSEHGPEVEAPPVPAPAPPTHVFRPSIAGESCMRTDDCESPLRCQAQQCVAEAEKPRGAPSGAVLVKEPNATPRASSATAFRGTFIFAGPVYGGVTRHLDAGLGGGISFGQRINRIVGMGVFGAIVDIPDDSREHDTSWVLMGGLHVGDLVFGEVLLGAARGNRRATGTNADGYPEPVDHQTTEIGAGLMGGAALPLGPRLAGSLQLFVGKAVET